MSMTMLKQIKTVAAVVALSVATLVAGCSGDGRPLLEAVETNELDLKSITIAQPVGLLSDLIVNTGVSIQFSLIGVDSADRPFTVSSSNRRWSVTPDGAASIDGNGLLKTIENSQDLVVKVQIGGFGAEFDVRVENSTLESITAIAGPDSLERCLPQSYSATGTFSDGRMRGLPDAIWTVNADNTGLPAQSGRVATTDTDGIVSVTAVNVGNLELVVTQDNVSGLKTIVVEDTLQQIVINPVSLAVQEGNTLSLGATGVYLKDEVERDVAITNSVEWSVPPDNDVATITNDLSDKGVITPIAVGNTQVDASCGDVLAQKPLIVIERGTTSVTDLTFDGDSPRSLSLSAGPVQLRVSTGTVYDTDDDISTSDDTDWAVVSGSEFVRFSTTDGKNTIVPIAIGVATVRATYEDTTEILEIQVTP